MNENTLYVGVVLALLAATGAFVALAPAAGAGDPSTATDRDYETTVDGVRYTVHPSELAQGCNGRDCIQSIDDPQFQPAANATGLDPDAQVIGIERDGEARAYPLDTLAGHEIVNDRIGGEPIAVTYCPLCRSGIVFSRTVDGETLTFGVSGKLLNANLVMYDRETGTYWSQLQARAIVGPGVPAELDQLPSTLTTWGKWRDAHPETVVLSSGVSYGDGGGSPYRAYRESDRVGYGVNDVDDRLPTKAIVYGVTAGNESKAYPEDVVLEAGIVQDEVGGVPVVVVEDLREGGVSVFVRELDDTTLAFTATDEGLVDGDGNRWSFDGEALEGPYQGRNLTRLDTHGFFWFAWSRFHPETDVYRAGS